MSSKNSDIPPPIEPKIELVARDMIADIGQSNESVKSLIWSIARDPNKALSNTVFGLQVIFEIQGRLRGYSEFERGLVAALATYSEHVLAKVMPSHPVVKFGEQKIIPIERAKEVDP